MGIRLGSDGTWSPAGTSAACGKSGAPRAHLCAARDSANGICEKQGSLHQAERRVQIGPAMVELFSRRLERSGDAAEPSNGDHRARIRCIR